MVRLEGKWVIGDINIMRYIGGDERMTVVAARINHEGLIEEISCCLRIN